VRATLAVSLDPQDQEQKQMSTSEPHVPEPCQGLITNLVLRCGRGDEAALGSLFDLTFFLVAAAVNRDRPSSTAVDDEVVEAFRRIWRRSPGYRPTERGVLAWVLDQVHDDHSAIAIA
jgi:hypothetical protein